MQDDVEFASSLDAEGKPTHCWPKRASCPGTCAKDYNLSRDAFPYVGLKPSEISPPPEKCKYILQSGVMMLRPLNLTAFNTLIVEPVRAGLVSTYDSGDQGIISTLLYGPRRLFGDNYQRLHPLYNVIARHAKHTEQKWKAPGQKALTSALLHFTRETRPWQISPRTDNVTRAAEWTRSCGPVVCMGLQGKRHNKTHARLVRNGYTPPTSIGIHAGWEAYCGFSNKSTTAGRNGTHSHHADGHHHHVDGTSRKTAELVAVSQTK